MTRSPRDAETYLVSEVGERWAPATVPSIIPAENDRSLDLHALDHWYRLDRPFPGGAWLEFGGLATLAEIWLDGTLLATNDTMFLPFRLHIPPAGARRLDICFRALRPALRRRQPGNRPRWLGRLATEEGLRNYRTTLLGHMPGWSGDAPIIGPYRKIELHEPAHDAPVITHTDVRTTILPDGNGLISVRLSGDRLGEFSGWIAAADQRADLAPKADGLRAELTIPDPPLWWPHTHGEPVTCALAGSIGGHRIDFGRVGFRTISLRDPAAGFGLLVNGTPVFCRGAIWTGLDPSALPADPVELAASLRQARDAGLNMLRVTGMTVYETAGFFALCDELGIMVWHDFMLARFDYPQTGGFEADIRAEARAFLDGVQAHPCLTVLCGGSEVAQAAAMAGSPCATWHIPLFEQALAEEAAAYRPDVPYVPHAPWSGADEPGPALPFAASAPIAHYFGVGAYLRPLDDLASAGVRFAAECLAFANVPEPASCRDHGGNSQAAPHDLGAHWDFSDIRDHYVRSLFGADPDALRRQDPERGLELGRTAVAYLMQRTVAAWRTDGRCAGALVLMLHDVVPGAGWGMIGHDGRPKSALFALGSVSQPIQVLLSDLGHDGVFLHAINETATPRHLRLILRALSPEGDVEALGQTVFPLDARTSRSVSAATLMGRWRDLASAWRFGPPAYCVLGAILEDAETGVVLSDATHFPAGPALPRSQPHLVASVDGSADGWALAVSARDFAQFVHIDDDYCDPADNYFHLWPGETKVVTLRQSHRRRGSPQGTVGALNAFASARYGLAA